MTGWRKLVFTISLLMTMVGGMFLIGELPPFIYHKEYIFYAVSTGSLFCYMAAVVLLAGYCWGITLRKRQIATAEQTKKATPLEELGAWMSKHWKYTRSLLLFTVVFLFYLSVTNVVFVSKDDIFIAKPWKPAGETYQYKEVEEVNVHVPWWNGKEIRYIITMKDGTKANLVGGAGKAVVKDTYAYIQDFDKRVVQLGVKKYADSTGLADVTSLWDRKYQIRWKEIFSNMPV